MSEQRPIEALALSASDLAALLGVSVRQIWSMHSAGTLGPVPVSLGQRLARWDRAEIEAWWAACRAAGRPIPRAEWLRTQREGEQ